MSRSPGTHPTTSRTPSAVTAPGTPRTRCVFVFIRVTAWSCLVFAYPVFFRKQAHIGAVVKNWSNGPQCGEFVQICNPKKNNHCVKGEFSSRGPPQSIYVGIHVLMPTSSLPLSPPVRVVDKCAGCGENHVDLTKSAFKKLSPSGTLTEGRIHGLEMFSCSQKVNPWDRQLYGPFKLKL